MAKQQNKSSVSPINLNTKGMRPGGKQVLDRSVLPKPTLPAWDGWKNLQR